MYLSTENKDKNFHVTNSYYKKSKAIYDSKIKADTKVSIDPTLIIILIRIGLSTPQPELL